MVKFTSKCCPQIAADCWTSHAGCGAGSCQGWPLCTPTVCRLGWRLTIELVRSTVQVLLSWAAVVVMYTSNTLRATCWAARVALWAAMALMPALQLDTCRQGHHRPGHRCLCSSARLRGSVAALTAACWALFWLAPGACASWLACLGLTECPEHFDGCPWCGQYLLASLSCRHLDAAGGTVRGRVAGWGCKLNRGMCW